MGRAGSGMPSAGSPSSKRRSPPVKRRGAAVAPSGSSLVCTLGPVKGQEFTLEGEEMVMGRSPEAAISVADGSMSRRHATFRKTEEGWAVHDLGSGNGTMINGAEIFDETTLANNDVVAMGDSEFTFVNTSTTAAVLEPIADEPAEIVPSRRPPVRTARSSGLEVRRERSARVVRRSDGPQQAAPNGLRKVLIRFGGVLAIVMALGVGWKAIDNKKKLQLTKLHQVEAEHQQEMDAQFQEAKRLAHDGKWVEAKTALLEIQTDDPDYEPQSVQQYIERADLELPNQVALHAAEEAIKAGQVGAAMQALAKVQNSLGPTETKRAELTEQLQAKVNAKAAEARGLLAPPLDASKLDQVKAIADDILVARPDDREATELKRQAEAALQRLRNPGVAPAVVETPWVEVQNRFRAGDPSGALSLAEACAAKAAQCRTLDAEIKEFNSKLKSLEQLPENDLYALFELDRKIAGGVSSDQSKPIRTRVAAVFFLKASQAKTTGNWAKAIDHSRRALQAEPTHPGAVNLLSEARSQAKDVYLRGYQLKDSTPDEAARLFKEVISMTPKDDEYHQKADARLAELQSK